MSIKIKDLQSGTVHEYGTNHHDSLAISQGGRYLYYYNLQNGDGSRSGDYRFVMDDDEIPEASSTPDALHAECYFNIGGFTNVSEVLDECISNLEDLMIEETVDCDDCAYNAGIAAAIDKLNKLR